MLYIVLLLCFLSRATSFQRLAIHQRLPIASRHSGSSLLATAFPEDSIPEPLPPPYNPLDIALLVFSDAYFYDDEDDAARNRERRANVLGNMTVGEVYRKFALNNEKGIERGLLSFAISIRAREEPILKYFAPATISPEEILALKKSIDLTDSGEIPLFDQRKVDNIPTVQDIWSTTINRPNSRNETSRRLPLGLVLGPSGSGKTFFALQYLSSQFLNDTTTDRVTIYLKASKTGIKFDNETKSAAATELFAWIKSEIATREKVAIEGKLGLHVCLIIDEAGAENLKWWFEDEAMLAALCGEARKLATSVAVVVLGTGLTGRDLSSTNDAFVFRMKKWKALDLARILHKEEGKLFLETHETTETVAKAIFAHPELGALATNGRAAYFLSKAIQRKSKIYSRVSWQYQLDEWAPALVADVVEEYIASNGIDSIDRIQRRRVAASIFRALHDLKAREAKLPTLEGIAKGQETSVAASLLQYNLEIDGTIKVVSGEMFAFTVTPAIAIVLYAMAGISTSVMPGWKAEENVAALYACRQWILGCMESFLLTANKPKTDQSALVNNPFFELEQSLGRLRLVALRACVQGTSPSTAVSIPMVSVGTIIVNGDKASFANIIAPYSLIQTKRVTTTQYVDFDLSVALRKCCLTVTGGGKVGKYDTRLLQGLVAMWQGNLDPLMFVAQDDYANPKTDLYQQISPAFPGNLLCADTRTADEKIRYATIEGLNATIEGLNATEISIDNGTKLPLPSLDGMTLTFVVSTNAKTINLKLSSEVVLEIKEANLDDDLSLNSNTLSDAQRRAWELFLKNNVRQDVKIRFLFTRSVRPGP